MKIRLFLSAIILFSACASMMAQDDQFNSIVRQFESLNRDAAREKVYLHTDKNFYLAGEIIWFKIYNVNGSTHRVSDISKTGYV